MVSGSDLFKLARSSKKRITETVKKKKRKAPTKKKTITVSARAESKTYEPQVSKVIETKETTPTPEKEFVGPIKPPEPTPIQKQITKIRNLTTTAIAKYQIAKQRERERGTPIETAKKLVPVVKQRIVKAEQKEEFTRIGVVPTWAREQITVPSSISFVPGVSSIYTEIAYATYLGMDTTNLQQKLDDTLSSNKEYVKGLTYKHEGKEYTYEELIKKEPALQLKKDEKGQYNLEYDYVKWAGKYYEDRDPITGTVHRTFKGVLDTFDPGMWFSLVKGEIKEYASERIYRDIQGIKKGQVFETWVGVQLPAYETVILPALGGAVFGAAIGGLEATSIGGKTLFTVGTKAVTVTKATQLGTTATMGTIGAVSVAPVYIEAYQTGNWDKAILTTAKLGIGIGFGAAGYKAGHAYGYGKVETYKYFKSAYPDKGSPEYIRAKLALKTTKHLKGIKPKTENILDVYKDMKISKGPDGLNKSSIKAFEKFLQNKEFRDTYVLSGSSTTAKQMNRGARDFDLVFKDLATKTKASQFLAKQYTKFSGIKIKPTPKGLKEVGFDIHTSADFGHIPGQYHGLGFYEGTSSPITIKFGGTSYTIRGTSIGTQLIHKAVAVARIEKQFRWGDYPNVFKAPLKRGFAKGPKDIADFVDISLSQINIGRTSFNPIIRASTWSAQRSLNRFIDPFPQTGGIQLQPFVSNITGTQPLLFIGKVSPTTSILNISQTPSGYSLGYSPVKTTGYVAGYTPSGYIPLATPSYILGIKPRYTPTVTPRYKPIQYSYESSKITPYPSTPVKTPSKITPYPSTPVKTPSKITPYPRKPSYPPSVKSFVAIPTYPSSLSENDYIKSVTKKPKKIPTKYKFYPSKKRKTKKGFFEPSFYDTEYSYRRFKVPSMEQMLKGGKPK